MSATTIDDAQQAFDRKDFHAALDAANHVIQTDARSAKAWRLKLAALRKIGDAGQAEDAASEALRVFPNADWPLGEHAQAAAARGDAGEALERFAVLRRRFAGSAAGYVGAIRLARHAGREALAETLLAEGLRRLPDNQQLARLCRGPSGAPPEAAPAAKPAPGFDTGDPEAALAEILLVGRRKSEIKNNRALALTMFAALHDAHPGHAPGYAAHIEFLLQTDRAADAAALAEAVRARFPGHFGINAASVKALSGTGEFDRALALLARLKDRFPDTAALHSLHVHVLADAGQDNAAERAAEHALAQWPQDAGLWREYARIATRRGDWTAALERWLEAQRRRPDDKPIAMQVQIAQAQLCISVPAEPSASLYGRFESLGGEPLGCEFGIVQREGGSDTVGLLRWAAISLSNLVEALDSDLEGFGADGQTTLTEVTEYYGLRDTRYGLFTHTFVKRADAPHDKMLLQSCRRMRFLADKLREELAAGEKIFVYKSAKPLPDNEVIRLHDAIARRGGKALLCLQPASAAQAAGSVHMIRPNLFAGHVGFFMSGNPTGHGARFDNASYAAICSRVASLTEDLPAPR